MSRSSYLKFILRNLKRNYNNHKLHDAIEAITNNKSADADKFLYQLNTEFENKLLGSESALREQVNVKRLEKFRNIHEGEDCFIIGNGPSLNKIDLEKLNNYHTFGMNKIYLIFDRVPLDLSYYVSVNSLVVEQSANEISQFDIPCFLSKRSIKNEELIKENIYPLTTCGDKKPFEADITQPIPEGYTVTFVALQIAYFMGFKRVFLVGVDHNFVQKGNPNETQVHKGEDVNHFDPRYFSGNQWQLADLEGSELFYRSADFYYKRNNRQVIDATHEGKLQIFPKISFEESLKMAQPKSGS